MNCCKARTLVPDAQPHPAGSASDRNGHDAAAWRSLAGIAHEVVEDLLGGAGQLQRQALTPWPPAGNRATHRELTDERHTQMACLGRPPPDAAFDGLHDVDGLHLDRRRLRARQKPQAVEASAERIAALEQRQALGSEVVLEVLELEALDGQRQPQFVRRVRCEGPLHGWRTSTTTPVTRSPRRRRFPIRPARADLLALSLLLCLLLSRSFLLSPVWVTSESMSPTIQTGEIVIVLERGRGPARGDVVVFRAPGDRTATTIKRVVGLPRDRVALEDGRLFVNGRAAAEPADRAVAADGTWFHPVPVPDGHVLVLSDDRDRGIDSRHYGPVPLESVEGRAALRLWPPALLDG
jgi:signal peptidase I